MFGQDFVKGLFSKEWSCRENSLRYVPFPLAILGITCPFRLQVSPWKKQVSKYDRFIQTHERDIGRSVSSLLSWLGQLLIPLLQECKAAVELNGQSVRITTLQECMAGMLGYMALDPVHKVCLTPSYLLSYVNPSLKWSVTLLSLSPPNLQVYITTLALVQAVTLFSAPETKSFLSFVFQPVFEVVFIRCTDPTR